MSPTTPEVFNLLRPQLEYVVKEFLRGAELWEAKKAGRSHVRQKRYECWNLDHKERLMTSFGFVERITDLLTRAGYRAELQWATEEEAVLAAQRLETVYRPDWSELDRIGFEARYKQREALELMLRYDSGRIDCPPAYGKTKLVGVAACVLRKAKIAIISRSVPVVTRRIYPELCQLLPNVGVVGGGMKRKHCRVMCYTFGSLAHAPDDFDYVFVDEGHQACADDAAYQLGKFNKARMWSFSASWNKRLDNKDMLAEAMFGPIRLVVTDEEAVGQGMIVPTKVIWSDVIMDMNPCSGYEDVDKKRWGIWRNDYRNSLIARDARRYGPDVQTLITVETLEHAFALKKFLPEFKLVYAAVDTLSPRQVRRLSSAGLMPDELKPMTRERFDKLTRMYEKNQLKKVIVTTTWNVGVNFVSLEVLLRADGGGSPINDVQIPGRTRRTNDEGKQSSIIHDYLDQFDTGMNLKAQKRMATYGEAGRNWEQVFPDGRKYTPPVKRA